MFLPPPRSAAAWNRHCVISCSVSCERESSAASESRRSTSFERQASLGVDAMSVHSGGAAGPGSASDSTYMSSGYASYSVACTPAAAAAPQFTLPLIDQLVCVAHNCTLSVLRTLCYSTASERPHRRPAAFAADVGGTVWREKPGVAASV